MPRSPSCAPRSTGCLEHGEVAPRGPARGSALYDYGFLRLRPDVLAWADRVARRRPRRHSPLAAVIWTVGARCAAWMEGDLAEAGRPARPSPRRRAGGGGDPPPSVFHSARATRPCSRAGSTTAMTLATAGRARSPGTTGQAIADRRAPRRWPCALRRRPGGRPSRRRAARASEGNVEDALRRVRLVLRRRGRARPVTSTSPGHRFARGDRTGRADRRVVRRGRRRHIEGVDRGRPATRSSPPSEYRRLLDHWRRAGMWSTQWTMLRAVAAPAGPTRPRPRARPSSSGRSVSTSRGTGSSATTRSPSPSSAPAARGLATPAYEAAVARRGGARRRRRRRARPRASL